MAVHVEWAPQKIVWVAVAVSVVGVLVCIGIVCFARKRRRRPAPPPDEPPRPFDPVLARPGRPSAALGDGRVAVAATAVATVALAAFMLVDTPKVAWQLALVVPYAAAVWWAFRSPRGRSILGLAGGACLALAAAFIFVQQLRHGYGPDFSWPNLFDRVHILGLLAVFLLAAEAVRELVMLRFGGTRRLPSERVGGRVDHGPAPADS